MSTIVKKSALKCRKCRLIELIQRIVKQLVREKKAALRPFCCCIGSASRNLGTVPESLSMSRSRHK